MFESTPDLSVSTVAEIVRLALAPVFLSRRDALAV